MVLRIIPLFLFVSIIKYNFFLKLNVSSIENKTILEEDIQNRIKLYLPQYQNKNIRTNEINNTNFNFSKIRNTRNTVLVTDDILEVYDETYRREKIQNLINDYYMNNLNGKYNIEVYPAEYTFYGTRNHFLYDHNYVWHKYIIRDTIIYEKSTSIINEVINTEPQRIKAEVQICSTMRLFFYIYNPDPELNLLIKDIRSDIYQLQIFPYKKDSLENKCLYHDLSKTIPPKEKFTLEIFITLDYLKNVFGTLYIEFNDKKVLLIPIRLFGIDNQFGVSPVYYLEAPIKKYFQIPIKISNPLEKVLSIKKVNHKLKKINIVWPNGSLIESKSNLPSSSLFQIQPKSSKNIIYLKYYSASPMYEYSLLQIETTDIAIIIPVLINSISSPILTYPKFFNFGLCQITSKSKYNIRKLIPINLSNIGVDSIKIIKVYLEYDNIFIQFHQNFNGNNIIIAPNEEIKFGYLIFDANLIHNLGNVKNKVAGKLQKGSLYIETNSTDCPFIQVNYSFLPDLGKIEKIISGDIQKLPKQKNKFNFQIKVKYNAPYGLEINYKYKPGENMTLLYEKYVETKVINPKNEDQKYNVNIFFEIEKLDIFHFKRFFYIPLFLTYSLYTFIPVQLDNNDINIVYCGTEENSISLASCIRKFGTSNMFDNLKNESHKLINFKFNFGYTFFPIRKQRFIYLINENSSPIIINQIKTENKFVTLGFENIEYIGNEEPIIYDTSKVIHLEKYLIKNIQIKNRNEKIGTGIILHPYTAIKFSINFNSNYNDNMKIEGKNIILYNNKSKFIIDNVAHVCKGSFNIIQNNIRFEPAFPSLVQSVIVNCENTMVLPVYIHSVKSSDDRIIPTVINFDILPENKTQLLKIIFDPSIDSLYKKYLNAIDFSKILTYKELYLWKEREKYFNKLRVKGKTEINANITVDTSMGKRFIHVSSDLVKPNLIKSTGITFGLVQIGKIISGYFEIFNPSDQVLAVKLLLAPNDYSDINNNDMLSSKEQELLKSSEDLFLLGCNFLGRIDNDITIIKEFEYIIIPENLELFEQSKNLFNKKELIKLIFKYGNSKVKSYLMRGFEVFCKYKKRNKNELIINYSKLEVVSSLFSEEFENEIEIVKNLSTRDYNQELKNIEIKKQSFWKKIYSYFLNLYIKYYLHVSINPEIKKQEEGQNFYLSDQVYNKIFTIQPHQKGKLGPVTFKPYKSGNVSETIFLKNNLTFLHPIRLLGIGGGAEPSFIPNYNKNPLANSHVFNNTNFLIEIDEQAFNSELKPKGKITKTITIKNIGNLEMKVKNITIDGNQCETNDLKVLQCEEFTLSPNEKIDIDIEIKPNINNYITNKNIYFITDYQEFNLNVIVYIAKEVYIKNNILMNKIIPIIILLILVIFLFFIGKIILKLINYFKGKVIVKEKLIKDIENIEEKSNFEDIIESENEKIKEVEEEKKIEEDDNIAKNLSKNKKKKLRKKNKAKSNEIKNIVVDKEKKEDIIPSKEKEEIMKEENKKEPEKKEDKYKEFKLYPPTTKKQEKMKSSIKKKEIEEKDKNNKNIEEKSNETDSLNEIKISNNKYDNNDKYKKIPKNYNNNNYNQKATDKNYQKYPGPRKSYYNTFNTFNTFNNYNNYNNYNSYNAQDEKKQTNTIKLSMDKKVNNLSELLTETKKEKKIKKKSEKEKNSVNENNDKYDNQSNEKGNKDSNVEQEDSKINENKINSNINFDYSNPIFNFEGFLKNDFNENNKINNYENSFSFEEGEDMNHFINKSLFEDIENPSFNEENFDKSRFFQFEVFKDKNKDNKDDES